jgi:hypothetical protein
VGSEHEGSVRKLAMFNFADAVPFGESGIMSEAVIPPEFSAKLSDAGVSLSPKGIETGAQARVLFRDAGTDGLSLVHLRFAPGYMHRRHSHDSDCLYYIITGEVFLGKRKLTAGGGFFVPADRPYTYRVGEQGVDVLEFRSKTSFDLVVHETSVSAVAERESAIAESLPVWDDFWASHPWEKV